MCFRPEMSQNQKVLKKAILMSKNQSASMKLFMQAEVFHVTLQTIPFSLPTLSQF